MTAIRLKPEETRAIAAHLAHFKGYLKTDQFRDDQEERQRRVAFFREQLPDRLPSFSEADLTELVTLLWATSMWGNKQYHAQQIIAENGIDKLRQELQRLFDPALPAASRYDRFVNSIKHLGPAATTEMLCYACPEDCGIWNTRARQAIELLGLSNRVNPKKYRLTAIEYQTFNKLLGAIAGELGAAGISNPDLLLVDFFLYDVATHAVKAPAPPTDAAAFDHDEIRDLLRNIGVMLGFDASTEIQVAHGARVDVVWTARIGNLGIVQYVFEVHKSGSLDSLLLNLQKAKSSPTVQKVIAVSDEVQLQKIRKECQGLPHEFSTGLALWGVAEVQEVGQHLEAATRSIEKLGLVQGF